MSNENQRETKTLTTPQGKELVLKTYITGREARAIQNVYLDKLNLKQTAQGQEMDGLKGSATGEAEDKAVEMVVVSYDNKTDDLVNIILDLPVSETNFIKQAINEVTNPKGDEKKKD